MENEIPLFEEYRLMASYFEKTSSGQYRLFPIFLTISVGFIAYSYKTPEVAGFLFQVLLFFIFIWLGFSHSMLHNYGLKLVEIECRINQILKLDEINQLSYFTNMIGVGYKKIPFFAVYSIALAVLLLPLYIASEYYFYSFLKIIELPTIISWFIILLQVVILLLVLIPILGSDNKIRTEKEEIIKRFQKN